MPPRRRDPNAPLSINERLAALARATGSSQEEAAETAGMPLAQLRRLEEDSRFLAEFSRAQQRLMPDLADRLQRRLATLQEPAVERLALLMDAAESEAVQYQSARHLLERGPLGPLAAARQSSPGQGESISLDQGALQAIFAGAVNAGVSSVLAACASLAGAGLPALAQPPARTVFLEEESLSEEESHESLLP